MGKMERDKGKRFEQAVAATLRERWPSAIVRRASQAERADNPDVFVEGGPPALERMWFELQDARIPRPATKLMQAESDASRWQLRRNKPNARWPIVVWHRLGERTTYTTMRLDTLLELTANARAQRRELVTLDLDALFEIVGSQPSEAAQ